MIERIKQLWVWVMLGSLMGIIGTAAIVPLGIHEYERRTAVFDRENPVVKGSGRILRMDGEAVEIEVLATRLRGECSFDRAGGASEDAGGVLSAIYVLRLGPGPGNLSYPEGSEIMSRWRLWPVTGAVAVHLLGMYQCDGRPVTAVIARVPLKGEP
jgi:hypothetical protein